MRLYPSIPQEARLKALKGVLERKKNKKISLNNLVKMAVFVHKSNYFEFNREVKVFFIWTYGKEKLEEFLKDFNNYHPNIKFTHELIKMTFPFWTLR